MRLLKKIAAVGIAAVLAAGMCMSSFAAGWENSPAGWVYQLTDGSFAANTWEQINGAWYYFNENGIMLENGITPDGYTVGADGAWVENIARQAQQAMDQAGITEEQVSQAASDAAALAQQAMDQAGITQADVVDDVRKQVVHKRGRTKVAARHERRSVRDANACG